VAEQQIVVCGGRDPDDRTLDDYVLGLSGRERPRVLLVPTAGGEDPDRILRYVQQLAGRADVSWLPFFPWPRADLREYALEHDVICVSGGNTANALAIWRVHGFDAVLREAWERGVVLTGWSAGMICWFEAGVTDSFGPELAGLRDGLGFLPGSACPHYDGEELRRPTYLELVRGGFPPGYAADDACALHFVGRELREVVAARAGPRAYRVSASGEEPLDVRVL
jgi:dipeptidase E